MAANSPVEIVNMALVRLGVRPIAALDEGTKAAVLAAEIYDTERDATLYDFEWNFANKRASLARDAAAPAFGFASSFQLPSDCIRVLETYPECIWRVEGRKLLCGETSIYIRYTRQVTSPSEWSPAFKSAFALRLAWQMSLALSELASTHDRMERAYTAILSTGRTGDSQESGFDSAAGTGADILLDTARRVDGLSAGEWWRLN